MPRPTPLSVCTRVFACVTPGPFPSQFLLFSGLGCMRVGPRGPRVCHGFHHAFVHHCCRPACTNGCHGLPPIAQACVPHGRSFSGSRVCHGQHPVCTRVSPPWLTSCMHKLVSWPPRPPPPRAHACAPSPPSFVFLNRVSEVFTPAPNRHGVVSEVRGRRALPLPSPLHVEPICIHERPHLHMQSGPPRDNFVDCLGTCVC